MIRAFNNVSSEKRELGTRKGLKHRMDQGWWSVAIKTALGLSWDVHGCIVRIISAADGLVAASLGTHLRSEESSWPASYMHR